MTVRGMLYILSAPSGAGKTTLVKQLVAQDPKVKVSVSHTTRPARAEEKPGKEYHFVELSQFDILKEKGYFIETAQVFGNWYGTSKDWLESQLSLGFDVILEIDWQGARRIREIFSCTSIFILPPTQLVLLDRLTARAQDDSEIISKRMQEATKEMMHYSEYDYLIVNDDFEAALADLQAIIRAGRSSMVLQCERYSTLISELMTQ